MHICDSRCNSILNLPGGCYAASRDKPCHTETVQAPRHLTAREVADLTRRIGDLRIAINERNAELGIYSESALTGKALEEIINPDKLYGLSAKSLEDLDRDADGIALEDIFEEADV